MLRALSCRQFLLLMGLGVIIYGISHENPVLLILMGFSAFYLFETIRKQRRQVHRMT